ncbi:MAG: tRNA dihydrouridine synthase DusB [Sphingomonas taxi]|uniref:tRNA-dihydrouridine synthase n=1 Tax=Sphingomonas taxi TaxID=1549858 RepID=A0A2W5AUS4_9SPHN|nr:MAG: tRNA dihydrouridine synthase DusB [Sphingomonas taxi]
MLKKHAPHGIAAATATYTPDQLRIGPLCVGGHRFAHGVALAPLSGISDVPFRRLVRSFGIELVYSEMVASGEYVKGDDESLTRAGRAGSGFHAVQLAGREPAAMREAAHRLADAGADLIDINMGCPAKKVVGGQSGSALMRDLDLASRLVAATVEGARDVPVTVKMRLGWDRQSLNAADLAVRAQDLGARLVTVHGRTRDQFYEGSADWKAIAEVKRAVGIPVLANGDLVAAGDDERMLAASGADGVMIGRGSCGRPWFPALVAGVASRDELARIMLADLVVRHYDEMLSHYGQHIGVRHARKHLGWYCDRVEQASGACLSLDRAALMASADPGQVRERLRALFGSTRVADLEPPRDTAERVAA